MNQSTIKYCKDLCRHNKVKQLSPTLFEVENHQVKIQVKQGRQIIICNCENSSFFGHNQICSHKLVVINFLFNKTFSRQLEELIEVYSNFNKLKLKVNQEAFVEDLKNLRNL